MKEIWKEIKEIDGYYVSNTGKIMCKYKKYGYCYKLKKEEPHIIIGHQENNGYIMCSINRKKILVHRLVAKAFIPNPNNLPQVNHKDGNKLNNNADNLEWVTAGDNVRHAFKTGLMDNAIKKLAERKIRAKKVNQYDKSGNFVQTFSSCVEASKKIKASNFNISACCRGIRKTAGGYIWKYAED